jgi:putative nucleotidyltransferase with HDIG domain
MSEMIVQNTQILVVGAPGPGTDEILEVLNSGHVQVTTAQGFADCAAAINKRIPDMVVISDRVADGTPISICSWIKGNRQYSTILVAMIIPVGELELKLDYMEAGADEVLLRPIERRALMDSIFKTVRVKRLVDHQITVENIIRSLTIAIEEKDHYTKGHSVRVAESSVLLARAAGVSEEQVMLIYRAALLHDIGQVAIEEGVLHKPGVLTEEELLEMRKHPEIALKILEPLEFPRELLEIILHHHEWWNGHGYPYGLARNKIPLGARIISIADAFDAMISERPYRAKMGVAMALNRLEDGANRQWDPDLVKVFLTIEHEKLADTEPEFKAANLWRDEAP